MGIFEKAQKAQENFDITASEVRKIYSAANKRNRGRLPELTGWYSEYKADRLYRTVYCEICDGLTGERLPDISLLCCLFDRRRSEILP